MFPRFNSTFRYTGTYTYHQARQLLLDRPNPDFERTISKRLTKSFAERQINIEPAIEEEKDLSQQSPVDFQEIALLSFIVLIFFFQIISQSIESPTMNPDEVNNLFFKNLLSLSFSGTSGSDSSCNRSRSEQTNRFIRKLNPFLLFSFFFLLVFFITIVSLRSIINAQIALQIRIWLWFARENICNCFSIRHWSRRDWKQKARASKEYIYRGRTSWFDTICFGNFRSIERSNMQGLIFSFFICICWWMSAHSGNARESLRKKKAPTSCFFFSADRSPNR